MVRRGIVDAWEYWTNDRPAREFMDTGRARGHPIIGAAVDAYVVEIRGVLMAYLHLTRGIEWS